MEVMGIAIALLGIILVYIWISNGQMQKSAMEGQREIYITRMLFNQDKDLRKDRDKLTICPFY